MDERITQIHEGIQKKLPEADFCVGGPTLGGFWFLDVGYKARGLVIDVGADSDFGLTSTSEQGDLSFGSSADCLRASVEDAIYTAVSYLRDGVCLK